MSSLLDDWVNDRGKGFLELPMLNVHRDIARKTSQRRDLSPKVLHSVFVVLYEQKDEVNTAQFPKALMGKQCIQHDQGRSWLPRGVTSWAGETIDEQQAGVVVPDSLGLVTHDWQPPV